MKFISANASEFVPASHEDVSRPGVLKRVIATAADLQTGTVPMVNWSHLPAGNCFALHYHEDMQEVFVLLTGHVKMKVDDETVAMQAGDAGIVDAGDDGFRSTHAAGMAHEHGSRNHRRCCGSQSDGGSRFALRRTTNLGPTDGDLGSTHVGTRPAG